MPSTTNKPFTTNIPYNTNIPSTTNIPSNTFVPTTTKMPLTRENFENSSLKKLKEEIELLKSENSKLTLLLEKKNSNIGLNIHDLIIYILTGVFIIIFMEHFSKIIRKI